MIEQRELELHTTAAGDLDLPSLGRVLAACGYFRDATKVSQAITKVLAGREIGIGPIAALRSIHIVEGKVELSATLIASLIRRHDRYDYRLIDHTDERCEIEIVRDGLSVGRSVFTIADAQAAGLVRQGSAWTKYPRNMLFARAMSNAARWMAPDVFQGEIYAEGEIEIHDVDVVEEVPIVPDAAPARANDPSPAAREPDKEPLLDGGSEEAAVETEQPSPDERTVAMRRLHAEATRRGVPHEELSAWGMKSFKVASMTELDAEQLGSLLAGLQANEVPPASGWPHVPATSSNERSRSAQWTVVFKRARDRGVLDPEVVKQLFVDRYGFPYEHATITQVEAFGNWVREWLSRRAEAAT